ncbi:MAG: hypothetical protein R3E01_30160 [Pirellulaceae bacterium]|nr:hypothetical protein [Planctomycetales bacterium]
MLTLRKNWWPTVRGTLAVAVALASAVAASPLAAQEVAQSRRHAIIIAGLPGDSDHQARYQRYIAAWHTWLEANGWNSEQIHIACGWDVPPKPTLTFAKRDNIMQLFRSLAERMSEQDELWIFFLGHADYDGSHARLHIPGPDLRDVEYAELLAGLPARRVVIWATTANSGWFLRHLSQPGRVVVTATSAEAEPNETEFPEVLTEVLMGPLAEADRNKDGQLSVLELFLRTATLVQQRYDADQRTATEHALLDDDGNGTGSEVDALMSYFASASPPSGSDNTVTVEQPDTKAIDGAVADGIMATLPSQTAPAVDDSEPTDR